MKKTLFWIPRILTIVFILFVSLFAFDALNGDQSILEKTGAFLIHLIPSAILIILLAISWRREWIGGIFFFFIGIAYIVWAWGKFPILTYIIISGPLFIIAFLFLVNWIKKEKTSTNHS